MGVFNVQEDGGGEASQQQILPGLEVENAEPVENAKGVPPAGKSVFELEPENEDLSPIEEVNLTVPVTDDPALPVWTFRMWTMGIAFCAILSFLNEFFGYRTEPLTISSITAQIVAMPLGRFMARVLPRRTFWEGTRFAWSLNPGPFNTKEHVLITIFANSGAGSVYALSIVTIVKVFYVRKMTFFAGLLLSLTTQLMGYGFAGIFRDYLIKPGVMWWPSTLVQVSLFRALHEKESRSKWGYTRLQLFFIVLIVSFSWYVLPGYLFPMLSTLSWVCWVWPDSILAHQLGSGLRGLGLGAMTFDWSVVSSFLGSPLATPWFAIANIAVGYCLIMYVMTPIVYWNNIYNAKTFPIFSSKLFQSNGKLYDVKSIVNADFELDIPAYDSYGKVHISSFFAMTYGVGFAALSSAVTHVALFYGKDIWKLARQAVKGGKEDVHTRLMKAYREVPQWWFHLILIGSILVSVAAVQGYKSQLQLPWWGVLFACGLGLFFTLPLAIICATTNQLLGLNIITEYVMGYIYPGRPVANVCFKTYGYMSMYQAVTFLQDFKLGHYMKIPPISMFVAQLVGTVIAAVVYLGTAWWLLESIEHICDGDGLLPANSPWTCPSDRVFFDASVIWGLVGPKRIFGPLGVYAQVNWWFLVGAVTPVPVWLATKMWPQMKFFRYINMPILIGSTAILPPATSINYTMWIALGYVFQKLVFTHRKQWWARYNYVVSAGLDCGLGFMGVLLYFALELEKVGVDWWGTQGGDNCPLATCPTQKGLGQPNPNCPAT